MGQYSDPTGLSITSPNATSPLAVFTCVAGVVTLLITGYAYFQIGTIKSETEHVQSEIQTSQGQITELAPVASNLSAYNGIATGLHTLFDSQKRWEDILGNLQTRFYKKMKVSAIQIGEDKSISITGTTLNYTEYAKVYAAFIDANTKTVIDQLQVISVSKVDAKNPDSEITFTFKGTLTAAALKPTASSN